jgi:hypothetical protein
MKIAKGYNSKPTHISIYAKPIEIINKGTSRVSELWIVQEGVPRFSLEPNLHGGYSKIDGHDETLSYMTLDELLALRDECNKAIQELVK